MAFSNRFLLFICILSLYFVRIVSFLYNSQRLLKSYSYQSGKLNKKMISKRIENSNEPFIENVLDKYSSLPHLTNLALGSSFFTPPSSALTAIHDEIHLQETHKYGNILGYPALLRKLTHIMQREGLDMEGQDLCITAGANQAFTNVVLALADVDSRAILVAPYYFCHLTNLQLANVPSSICSFDKKSFEPNWEELEQLIQEQKPKLIGITSPNNPSGFIWEESHMSRLVELCRRHSPETWLVFDETYYKFQMESDRIHFFPNGKVLDYPNIIHIFSFSKTFGMPGWRVGFLVYPTSLTSAMRKIQDTIPCHAPILSQKLALACLETYQSDGRNEWFDQQLSQLRMVREVLWPVLGPLGTVRTAGAFYFLVPLPDGIGEEEAVDLLAHRYGVLLMTGSPFGAPGHLRLSYGSIAPEKVLGCVERLRGGLDELQELSRYRKK